MYSPSSMATSVLSLFGTMGILAYSPIFVQQVMHVSPTISGSMLTPYSLLTAFLGIPAGYLLARTKRYKWMYVLGYVIITIAMAAMWSFTVDTPIWLYVLVTSVAGFGFGAMPTINTLVAQFAVPRRLLGVAVGAMFFFQMVGMAAALSFLGLAQASAADLEGGLKLVFLIGAVCTAASLLWVMTIPDLSMDTE
ncbi:MAG TPA: MFS transporter [Anaerolineales bacterium]|nr:MFS transporter [Anaerolineales bacterium]HRF46798.1 MFS transporter [Anaerolineales bacterium]